MAIHKCHCRVICRRLSASLQRNATTCRNTWDTAKLFNNTTEQTAVHCVSKRALSQQSVFVTICQRANNKSWTHLDDSWRRYLRLERISGVLGNVKISVENEIGKGVLMIILTFSYRYTCIELICVSSLWKNGILL